MSERALKTEKSCGAVVFTEENGVRRYVLVCGKDRIWGFPKGHVEPGESFTEAVVREVREETGLTIEKPELCGVKQFYTEDGARYVVFLYRADRFSGEIRSSEEGRIFWVKKEDAEKQDLASGVASMLPVFFGDFPREIFWRYDDGVGVPEII